MNSPIRIVIADDHVLVRQGIRAFLETHADLAIVGEAEDGQAAIRLCIDMQPHVALLDLVMPGGGIETTRAIREACPQTQVVLLTSFEDPQQIVAAVRAGALSCLLQDVDAVALADARRKASRLMELLRKDSEPGSDMLDLLSQREREVLALIAEGLNNQLIAERLGIGEKTVKTHVSNVLGKLDVSDRTQAAVFAWKSGLKQRPQH